MIKIAIGLFVFILGLSGIVKADIFHLNTYQFGNVQHTNGTINGQIVDLNTYRLGNGIQNTNGTIGRNVVDMNTYQLDDYQIQINGYYDYDDNDNYNSRGRPLDLIIIYGD